MELGQKKKEKKGTLSQKRAIFQKKGNFVKKKEKKEKKGKWDPCQLRG